IGKPDNLSDLCILAQSLDHRYWERKAERNRETSGPSKSSSKSGSRTSQSEPRSSSNSQLTPRAPQKSSDGKSSASGSTPKSNSKPKSTDKSAPKPYADKLRKDGKLTPEERQHRLAGDLCLFCGGAGHSTNTCPKKSTPLAKGRAAQAEPTPGP
ncbi:hypothetical protein BD310DRAFT_792505, partial [Dichomitus squalens]